MTDWLDVMLEEIARKKRETREAEEEQQRRNDPDDEAGDGRNDAQSK